MSRGRKARGLASGEIARPPVEHREKLSTRAQYAPTPQAPGSRHRAPSLAPAPRRISRATIAWVSLAAVLALGGTLGAAARGTCRGPFGRRPCAARVPSRLGRDRREPETGDPARGRPRRRSQRVRAQRSAGDHGRLRAMDGIGGRDEALPGASEHRPGDARAGARPEGVRGSTLGADPVRALGAPAAVRPAPALQIEPAGRRPYYCLAVAGVARSAASYIPPGVDYCALSPQLILRPGPRAARICAVQRRARHDPRSGDAGLPRARSCPATACSAQTARSWDGSASCSHRASCSTKRCRGTRTCR